MVYASCEPAYNPIPESKFLTPENMHVLNDTPDLHDISLYSFQISYVKFLLSAEFVSALKKQLRSCNSSAELCSLNPEFTFASSGWGCAACCEAA